MSDPSWPHRTDPAIGTDEEGLVPGLHHVAYACRNGEETRAFYEDVMGFPLVHTEVKRDGEGWFRHLFFDLGDGSCIAFFELSGMGEQPDWRPDISTGNGLPVWVNHIAFSADSARQESVRATAAEAGVKPLMELDHGWCHSLYFLDPNGIMVELCRDTPGIEADPEEARRRLTSYEETDRSVLLG
jgi:catechol 2,3-dioxygenase-like lactoylglutathione lyase family enzyme